MPILSAGDRVLVTGGNGYIALWIIRGLLERGYSVRGAVRSAEKGKHLKDSFVSYSVKFEIAIVPDITEEGAFDEAVKGVHAIIHTASPVQTSADDPQELIAPALQGTRSILNSALKNGAEVKRIIITSSCAAVITAGQSRIYNEGDWNDASITEVEQKGRDAAGMAKYQASKTLAEKAAWSFLEKHREEVQWDLTVILPPYVFGPVIHEADSPSNLNTSMKFWWNSVVSSEPKTREALSAGGSWVDVRDLAEAHILALETESAGGERIIASAGQWIWQEWLDIANSLDPPPLPNHELTTGFPDLEKVYPSHFDNSRASRILGINWRSKIGTTEDILKDFGRHGW